MEVILFRKIKHPWIHALCHIADRIDGARLRAIHIFQRYAIEMVIFYEIQIPESRSISEPCQLLFLIAIHDEKDDIRV